MFGPFQIEKGLSTIMRSATGFEPTEAPHIRQSEICATCHTLTTKALGPNGDVIGELPEQMPFLEWQNSVFIKEQRSCQSCHMPVVEEDVPIASVLGAPRKGFARHTFTGGNFFVQRMLARYRDELGVSASADDLEASAHTTVKNLRTATAQIAIERARIEQARLNLDLAVENLAGHKLPTGYPSRRAWLHVRVRDRNGALTFESGAMAPNGSIQGNDNDSNPARAEPHHVEIREPGQVQVYESVMVDAGGQPTTGLLSAVGYLKDNRLLPAGFDIARLDARIAVIGAAARDANFTGGGDRIRYSIAIEQRNAPFHVDVELRFQVVSFRWADNLRAYKSEETNRFMRYYDAMASSSSELLATASAVVGN
jgi:hypothetical protein